MPTTTTYKTIRDNMTALVRDGITPAMLKDHPFDRAPRTQPLKKWAAQASSSAFRRFEFARRKVAEPGTFDPAAYDRNEPVTMLVAYPLLLGLYGAEDLDAVEDVIESDAAQIRDKLFSPSGYVSGQSACLVVVEDIDRAAATVWFQPFTLTLIFTKSQTL